FLWVLGGRDFALVGFEVLLGLAGAAPVVIRVLGHIVPGVVVTRGLGFGVLAIFAARSTVADPGPPDRRAVLALRRGGARPVLVSAGRRLLEHAGARLIRRRRQTEMHALQQFLHTLSPELGVGECCRRILVEIVRARRIPGAAIVLADGEPIVEGSIDVAPLL